MNDFLRKAFSDAFSSAANARSNQGQMHRVLILTAGFGEGHNAAARNLRAGLERLAPGACEVRLVDLFETCYGRANELVKTAYLHAINHTPSIWQKIYNLIDATRLVEASLGIFPGLQRSLTALVNEFAPHAVVSTYPVYGHVLDRLYGNNGARPFSQTTVITDSITVNSIWFRCSSHFFIVPNDATAGVLPRARVPAEKIKVLGFPVPLYFAEARVARASPADGPGRVLYMINSSKQDAPDLVMRLLALPNVALTVTVGRDEKLKTRIEAAIATSGRKAEVYGWTDKMPDLLAHHHLLITKAGGATVQEAIAARIPLLINQVVPGQEEGNARLIVENDCGTVATSNDAIVEAVGRAFASGGELVQKWTRNISKISRPDASLTIAKFVLDRAAERTPAKPRRP